MYIQCCVIIGSKIIQWKVLEGRKVKWESWVSGQLGLMVKPHTHRVVLERHGVWCAFNAKALTAWCWSLINVWLSDCEQCESCSHLSVLRLNWRGWVRVLEVAHEGSVSLWVQTRENILLSKESKWCRNHFCSYVNHAVSIQNDKSLYRLRASFLCSAYVNGVVSS